MKTIIPNKIFRAGVTLLLATLFAFMLSVLLPGDPARVIAGDFASEEQVETVRQQLGLDQSLVAQYGDFLGSLVQGDLGTSIQVAPGTPVTTLITDALPVTFSLVVLTLFWAVLISIPAGYFAARFVGSALDRGVTFITTLSAGVPPYVFCLLLIILFAVNRNLFPALGYEPLTDGFWPWLHSMILPSLSLGIAAAAQMTKVTRASFLEVLNRDFTRLTIAKGMPRRSVVWKHSFRNAAPPIITIIGLQAANLLGGTLIVEGIFVLPGLGSLAFEAVNGRDIVVIQGIVVFTTVAVLIVNLIVDVVNLYANPRSRAVAA